MIFMKEAVLIYPNQLFENSPILTKESLIFIIEDPLFFTQYKFHKQKLILHRASMKAYESQLLHLGHDVVYIDSKDIKNTSDIVNNLRKHNIAHVRFYDPVDQWLEERLIQSLEKNNIQYSIVDNPLFLTEKNIINEYFAKKNNSRKYLMKHFYEWQRKRLNILIEKDGKPTGGKWSFDTENRKRIPKGLVLPLKPQNSKNPYVLEAKKYIEKNFKSNYGSDECFFYPVTALESKIWFKNFLEEKLKSFGAYEDAITTKNNVVFHSVISPLLNVGLLTPKYVVEKTIEYTKENPHIIPLASLEGFIRQIIGWREYMRVIYVLDGSHIRNKNYFKASRNIPDSFWNGTTHIEPIDHTIKNVLHTAYSHHIERLMVMGNFMNLCGFNPNEVYKWFMELYIDSYDWVMVPNVYSMALYADGGFVTTKPYISGSNYILKMSDYKKGEWSDIWDALFWNFVGIHYEKLKTEARLGFVGILYQKMSAEQKNNYTEKANNFLAKI